MPSTADDLTAWVLAAGIEAELIQAEAATGHNVAFATRPLTRRERQAGTRFGDLDAIVTANTEAGTTVIDALYAAAAAALMVELFGNEEGEDTETVEVAAAVAALTLLLGRPPRRYARERETAQGKLTALIEDSYIGGVLTILDEAQSQGEDTDRWRTPGVPVVLGQLGDDIAGHPWQRTTEKTIHELQTPRKALAGEITRGEIADIVDGTSQKGTVDQLHQANQAAMSNARNDTAELSPMEPTFIVASEVMDKNTCGPCGAIDGTEFESLDEGKAAYPSGYINCEGGSRCRGVLVYGWDDVAG